METLQDSLFLDRIPPGWAKKAWPSKLSFGLWVSNFMLRLDQLNEWLNNPSDPQGDLDQRHGEPAVGTHGDRPGGGAEEPVGADKLVTFTEVTKMMTTDEVGSAAREVLSSSAAA